jgi:hypothetical protein
MSFQVLSPLAVRVLDKRMQCAHGMYPDVSRPLGSHDSHDGRSLLLVLEYSPIAFGKSTATRGSVSITARFLSGLPRNPLLLRLPSVVMNSHERAIC